jgi:hypothetical protein
LAIQRRILEHVGATLNWNVGWAAVLPSLDPEQAFAEVSLDEEDESDEKHDSDEEEPESKTAVPKESVIGVSATALRDSISSIDKFRQSYEVSPDFLCSCWIWTDDVPDLERHDCEALHGSRSNQSG